MREFSDIRLAYGTSDEYSFVLRRDTRLYGAAAAAAPRAGGGGCSGLRSDDSGAGPLPPRSTAGAACPVPTRTRSHTVPGRRSSKLVSVIASCFAANYVRRWGEHMGDATPLRATPAFDGRAVAYPSAEVLRDYLAWRQADCHINNQYNTPFWELVKSGTPPPEAQAALAGTNAGLKNELLFSRFGINYNDLPQQFRKARG